MIHWLKTVLRQFVPAPLLRKWQIRHRLRFDGPFANWDAAVSASEGYAAPQIMERVANATRRVVRGNAAFERDSVTFSEPQADRLLLAELELQAAIAPGEPLVVVDIGGSLGSSYHQHRRFLPAAVSLQWHVVEQPHYSELGAREFQTNELRFHATMESARQAAPRAAIVLLASVLPYVPFPWEMLEHAAEWPARVFIVLRTPFVAAAEDKVVVQHVPPSIYPGSYPSWVLSAERFIAFWQTRGAALTWHSAPEGDAEAGPLRFTYRSVVVRQDSAA